MMNTVITPSIMKVSVPTSDRVDRRPSPHTPWPLVQPLRMRVSRPTRNPLVAISHKGALGSAGTGWPMKLRVAKLPASKPSKNSVRRPRSGPPRESQAMPLMPAIGPSQSSSQTLERPINTPPVRDIRYICISVTLSPTYFPWRVSGRRRT